MYNVKICQTASEPPDVHNIADPGTEEMWIEIDGTPYVYYTGRDDRLALIPHGPCFPAFQC